MKGILESAKEQRKIISFVALFLFLLSALAAQPVVAQAPFSLNWAFDYSPLISGAPNTVQVIIQNTGFAPLRLSWVGIQFSWTQAAYLSTAESQSTVDIPPQQEVNYTIPFTVPADLMTGTYTMNTLVQYQIWQTTQYGGVEPIVYALPGVFVLGRTWSYSLSFDPYDGRFYSALALFILIGWYLPKKLRPKAKD